MAHTAIRWRVGRWAWFLITTSWHSTQFPVSFFCCFPSFWGAGRREFPFRCSILVHNAHIRVSPSLDSFRKKSSWQPLLRVAKGAMKYFCICAQFTHFRMTGPDFSSHLTVLGEVLSDPGKPTEEAGMFPQAGSTWKVQTLKPQTSNLKLQTSGVCHL